jgi:hypothetical protein
MRGGDARGARGDAGTKPAEVAQTWNAQKSSPLSTEPRW